MYLNDTSKVAFHNSERTSNNVPKVSTSTHTNAMFTPIDRCLQQINLEHYFHDKSTNVMRKATGGREEMADAEVVEYYIAFFVFQKIDSRVDLCGDNTRRKGRRLTEPARPLTFKHYNDYAESSFGTTPLLYITQPFK